MSDFKHPGDNVCARGTIEIIAFYACIVDGNHNNTPLIDGAVLKHVSRFWALKDETSRLIEAIGKECRETLASEKAMRRRAGVSL